MRTALVTGGHGFVGWHLGKVLAAAGWGMVAPTHEEMDLLDAGSVREKVESVRPDAVFHLAAEASVARSWQDPPAVVDHNVRMTINVFEAVRIAASDAVVVLASSGEVYGRPRVLPVDETAPLEPQNPYAASKAAADILGGQYADGWGLRVVRTRAFNHAGPGQPDDYVVGALARQVAEGELAGESEILVRTGNPSSRRDFSDVRDVVRAYELATSLPAGVYNVASGTSHSVVDIIETLREHSQCLIEHEVDPERLRRNDVPEVRGSAARLHRLTGWEPEIPFEATVRDALNGWRAKLAARMPLESSLPRPS